MRGYGANLGETLSITRRQFVKSSMQVQQVAFRGNFAANANDIKSCKISCHIQIPIKEGNFVDSKELVRV